MVRTQQAAAAPYRRRDAPPSPMMPPKQRHQLRTWQRMYHELVLMDARSDSRSLSAPQRPVAELNPFTALRGQLKFSLNST